MNGLPAPGIHALHSSKAVFPPIGIPEGPEFIWVPPGNHAACRDHRYRGLLEVGNCGCGGCLVPDFHWEFGQVGFVFAFS